MNKNGRRGFSLAEIVIVIVIMGIIVALVALGGSSSEGINAQTEARRYIRTLQTLRSAWIAAYADTGQMIGITMPGTIPSNPGAGQHVLNGSDPATQPLINTLTKYTDRIVVDDIRRYGGTLILRTAPVTQGNAVYLGFQGRWDLSRGEDGGPGGDQGAKITRDARNILISGDYDLFDSSLRLLREHAPTNDTEAILMRIY